MGRARNLVKVMTSEELGEELRRLSEIAIPELLAIPWFEKVGQPSGLPKHFGRWEPDSGKAFKSQEMRFKDLTFVLRDLSSHIGTWHPAGAWTLERARAGTVIHLVTSARPSASSHMAYVGVFVRSDRNMDGGPMRSIIEPTGMPATTRYGRVLRVGKYWLA